VSKRSYEKRIKAKRDAAKAARKRAERMRKIRIWVSSVTAVGLALVLFFVLRGDGEPVASPSPTPTSTTSTAPAVCTGPTPPKQNGKQYAAPPAKSIDENQIYVATIKTTCGDYKMQMDPKVAPTTVNNFVFLARENFYDGIKFHRIEDVPGDYAIIQGGDPAGTGNGGPGYDYDGETPVAGSTYLRGVVAMAKPQAAFQGQPPQNGSQFFVVVRDWPSLPAEYTIFGKIMDEANSFATLQKIVSLKSPSGSDPLMPIYILDVTIEELARS
jgi:peptidyl-prolyl cis-trans isomerase B (cyclophilin B)